MHLCYKALPFKARFFENSSGCGIVGMSEGSDFRET
jgi:hypothetical protein